MKTPIHISRSIRLANLMTMLAAASLVQACADDSITTDPSFGQATSTQGAPIVTTGAIRVSGTVTDDDGVPVAGVKVTVYRWTPTGEPHSAVSDDNGFYSVPFIYGDGISALAEKQGYERTWRSQSLSAGLPLPFDIRINRVRN